LLFFGQHVFLLFAVTKKTMLKTLSAIALLYKHK
jgi:hypothetical protein